MPRRTKAKRDFWVRGNKHLDELIHDIKVEATYMETDVDVDEIVDRESYHKRLDEIERLVGLLREAA